VLGYDKQMNFQLVDDTGPLPPLAPDPEALIAASPSQTPSRSPIPKVQEQAAQSSAKAQHEQLLPTTVRSE